MPNLVEHKQGLAIWRVSQIGRRPKDYPPGPPTLPLIGNLHQIPNEKRHLQFQKWAQEYGPVFSLMLGTKVMIVLSSDVVIKDLVDKRGVIYSSRPQAYIAQDILSGGLRPLFMQSDDSSSGGVWKMARRLSHQILNISAARTYVPYQDLENKAMLLDLLESPQDFIDQIRRYSASLTTQMVFGYRTTSIQDARFKQAFGIFDRSSELIASRTAVMLDLLPILRMLPEFLIPVKKEGREIHRQERKLFRDLYLSAKQGIDKGTAKPCVCADLVKLQKQEGFSDELAAYISGSLLQAGSETTASILVGFVQAMVLFPEVAKEAQAEIDRVCGDRMPDLNDASKLPYIRACAKESLRWMPGFFLGIPHAVTKDDVYQGYHIPKDATVILNVWGVHYDPERHPDPRRFDPTRYINDIQSSIDAAINPDATKRDHFVFGAGRRRCQGIHIADRSIFLALSRMLWAFDFRRAVDPGTLQDVVPDMDEVVDGIMSLPKPFKANIVPRSSPKARKVREEWAEVSKQLDQKTLEWKDVPKGLIWGDEQPLLDDL
ncbi:cytochrome P450 [Pseudomassariella vexata]|uniref:Cytochrome P450 n=1 Tax=Pseudomassariella vexata TaxID=1141098 RepID=A0A1Y2EHM3_9PEZI|nr:cytochrome P450 [Pseudomassariella vexata]ORY71072.1 cytochrome P450 [Pseudomassariella vexata]